MKILGRRILGLRIECWPIMCEALGLSPSTTNKAKQNKTKKTINKTENKYHHQQQKTKRK
jgi:hypothetical protein